MTLPRSLRDRILEFFSPRGGIWFLSPALYGSGEEQVISDLESYARLVSQTIEKVPDIAKAYEFADRNLMESAMGRVYREWGEAEHIRWEIYRRIADGRLFFPDSRGDMVTLINTMSLILLTVKDPRLAILPDAPVQGELKFYIEKMGIACKDLARVLSTSIEFLNRDPAQALQEIQRTTEYEKEITGWAEKTVKWISEGHTEPGDLQAVRLIEHLMLIAKEILESIYKVQEIAIKYV